MKNPKIECNGHTFGGLSRTMERKGERGEFLLIDNQYNTNKEY